jgi:chloride channel 3/4/5
MSARGMTLDEVGEYDIETSDLLTLDVYPTDQKLDSSTVQGFPIISSDSQRALLGYIGRTELNYVLGKSFPLLGIRPAR